jgi:excinuclease ABC subunit C
MAFFEKGKPAKAEYRRFRIQLPESTGEPNDFAMMREMLLRRLLAAKNEDKKFTKLPDLMLIDGGKGQLSVALSAATEAGFESLNMIGLAKQHELVFVPGQSDPIVLPRNSQALYLLQRIRDEVHRFAITYHRTVRGRQAVASALDTIPGVGSARRKSLLKAFGSMEELKTATLEQIAAAPSMNKIVAAAVYNTLHSANA